MPEVRSDACTSARFGGGGYVSRDGRYRYWTYGAAARRRPIDELEGDTFVVAVEDMARTCTRVVVLCCIRSIPATLSLYPFWDTPKPR